MKIIKKFIKRVCAWRRPQVSVSEAPQMNEVGVLPSCDRCGDPTERDFSVMFGGSPFKVESSSWCLMCAQQHVDNHATGCANCGRPILPGEFIARADKALDPHPYPFICAGCCEIGGGVCGVWGVNHRRIPLRSLSSKI